MSNRTPESDISYEISYMRGVGLVGSGDETALIVDDEVKILRGNWLEKFQACKSKQEQLDLYASATSYE